MQLTQEHVEGLGVALNEAELVGVEVDPKDRWVGITLAVLTLPKVGPEPEDRRVQRILQPVGRIAASLRHGAWNDLDARVEAFEVDELSRIVASFEQQAMYGWEFIDVPEDRDFGGWSNRLSLDWRSEPGGLEHTITIFQEWGDSRHLGVCIWFDELRIFDLPSVRSHSMTSSQAVSDGGTRCTKATSAQQGTGSCR